MWRWLPVLFLAGCAGTATPSDYFARKELPAPTVQAFPSCRGYGCVKIDMVSLTAPEWAQIVRGLPAANAESERQALKASIATFEKIVGAKTGTAEDIEGTYIKLGPYQQDCVDESTNTTVYLSLLEQKNLLRFHKVMAPNSRTIFTSGRLGPHSTAVIMDNASGQRYAVDSWYHNNGQPAEIVYLSTWKSGWSPE